MIVGRTDYEHKSGAGFIVDYSRDHNVVNGVYFFCSISFSLNLRNYIFQSAKKCEMTSFSMTSPHVDLNLAAKLLVSLSRLCTLVQIQNSDDIWPSLRRFINQFMKVGGIKTWKEITTGTQQLVRLSFNNNYLMYILNFVSGFDAI